MDGFTLKLTNPPAGAVLWTGGFAENTWNYDPIADSGWLGVDETWEYPSDPLGCTTLRVWILDANNNILLDVHDLGPIEDGNDYVFDCSTAGLVAPSVPSMLETMIGLMMVVMIMSIIMKSMKEG